MWVKACMRVKFIHAKNGVPVLALFVMKSAQAFVVSSSMVCMRFTVSGPVSFDFAVGVRVDNAARVVELEEVGVVAEPIGAFGLFFGIEVVEVAEELVEAVVGRQKFVAVTEMVFAILAGYIA
jgi:hypothetical protein